MNPPTHKMIVDTDVAIARGGRPRQYVYSVAVEDYEAALRCAAWYKERLERTQNALEATNRLMVQANYKAGSMLVMVGKYLADKYNCLLVRLPPEAAPLLANLQRERYAIAELFGIADCSEETSED